jgi:carbonic anhydrase
MKRTFDALLPMILAVGLAGAPAWCHGAEPADWSYAGPTGPARWGKLHKSFALCAQGTAQSPIDIPDAAARKGDLPPILFNYKPSPLKIVDDGHTIRVDYAPGSWITVAGARYELVEFRFHKPGEHRIDGKSRDMDVQLVHKDKDGTLAVIAIGLEQGTENPLLKTLWSHVPQVKGKANAVDAVKISASGLLPQKKDYYTFAGSLTTPPCTEGVAWYVLKTPVQASAEQIARFARIYPMNARPVQPLNDRDIQGSL